MSLSPGDRKGAERGKKLLVEKIMQGKETGKWHNRHGKEEEHREPVTLPGPQRRRGRPGQGLKRCVEIVGMQEILEPFFFKGYFDAKIQFKGEARNYSHRKDIVKLWLNSGRWLKEHCHDSDWNKKHDANFRKGVIFHAVLLGLSMPKMKVRGEITKEIHLRLGSHFPVLSCLPACRVALPLSCPESQRQLQSVCSDGTQGQQFE